MICTAPSIRTVPVRVVLFLLVMTFAAGCGRDNGEAAKKIDLGGRAVTWSGFADADPSLKSDTDATMECLRANMLPTRRGYPYVVVIDGTFLCGGIEACGCTDLGGPYIYIDRAYLYSYAFTHEVIHWETGMGNAYHDTPQFQACTGVVSW